MSTSRSSPQHFRTTSRSSLLSYGTGACNPIGRQLLSSTPTTMLIARAEEMGPSAVLRRAPLLAHFAPRFLNWVNQAPGLAPKTRRYYRTGWQVISQTPLLAMTLDRITTEEVDSLALSGSPSYVNQSLRTLRRLL